MKFDAVVIDGRNLLWRSSSSFGNLTAEIEGKTIPTGGVYGFLGAAVRIFQKYGGTIVVAWEGRGKNWREAVFPSYKNRDRPLDAERLERIEEVYAQESILAELLSQLGVRQYEGIDCEADDVIARLTKAMAAKGNRVGVYTADSDLRQLVDDKVIVIAPKHKGAGEIVYDAKAVHEKHGVLPGKISDLKALAGDKSDAIPGVRGIGDKTAAKLIQHYGDLKRVLAAAETESDDWPVASRHREAVKAEAGNVRFYRDLARVRVDVRMKAISCDCDERAASANLERLMLNSFRFGPDYASLVGMGGQL